VFHSYTEIFTDRARSYHSAMLDFPHARDAEFEAVIEPLHDAGDGVVCDMPAGGGYLANYVPAGLRYVGVEPVEAFSASPVSRAAGATMNAPITAVPLESGSVDYVISLAGLHHEADLLAVFSEMRRLLKPGGRVVMADVAEGTGPARFLNGFVDRNSPQGHDGRFLDGATAPLVEQAGLAVMDDQLVEVPWLFGSREDAGRFCENLFGVQGIPWAGVADAMDEDIGFGSDARGLRLKWVLRRITCTAS
jgi:SAM-dependent methyltransferase